MESSGEVERAFLLSMCIFSLSRVVAEQVLSSIALFIVVMTHVFIFLAFLKNANVHVLFLCL